MYTGLYTAMQNYADGFLEVAHDDIPEDGAMTDQLSHLGGKPWGTKYFSWSYGAFLSANDRRMVRIPASWGPLNVSKVPEKCEALPVKEKYSPVKDVKWLNFNCKPADTIQVTLDLLSDELRKVSRVYIYGSVPELGLWDPKKAVLIDNKRYIENPFGMRLRIVPAGAKYEYKYRITDKGGVDSEAFKFQVEKTCWYAAATNDRWSFEEQ